MNMRRTTVITRTLCVALALALIVLAAGCAASASPSSPSAASTSLGGYANGLTDKASYDQAMPQEAPAAEDGGEGFSGSTRAVAEQEQNNAAGSSLNRKIIKTVNMYMETLEFDTLIASLTSKTAEFGGYVESSSVSGLGVNQKLNEEYSPTRSAYVAVRVPTAKLDEFTTLIGTLGNVTQKDENSEDITLTYADTAQGRADRRVRAPDGTA